MSLLPTDGAALTTPARLSNLDNAGLESGRPSLLPTPSLHPSHLPASLLAHSSSFRKSCCVAVGSAPSAGAISLTPFGNSLLASLHAASANPSTCIPAATVLDATVPVRLPPLPESGLSSRW